MGGCGPCGWLNFTTLFAFSAGPFPAFGGKEMNNLTRVDHAALRANQAFIIGLLLLGFFVECAPIRLTLVMAVMLGRFSAAGRPGFLPVYRSVLLRAGWVRPDPLADHPETAPVRPDAWAAGCWSVASLALLAGRAWPGLGAGLAGDLPGRAETCSPVSAPAASCTTGWPGSARPVSAQTPPPNTFPGNASPLEVSRCPSFVDPSC